MNEEKVRRRSSTGSDQVRRAPLSPRQDRVRPARKLTRCPPPVRPRSDPAGESVRVLYATDADQLSNPSRLKRVRSWSRHHSAGWQAPGPGPQSCPDIAADFDS